MLAALLESAGPPDRQVAADYYEETTGRTEDALLLRDPDLPPVLVLGDAVYRLSLGKSRQGRYVVEGVGPAGLLTVSPGSKNAAVEGLRNRLSTLVLNWLWHRHYEQNPPKKTTARVHMTRVDVNNGYVCVATAREQKALFRRRSRSGVR
jgi:hypothetical protein